MRIGECGSMKCGSEISDGSNASQLKRLVMQSNSLLYQLFRIDDPTEDLVKLKRSLNIISIVKRCNKDHDEGIEQR